VCSCVSAAAAIAHSHSFPVQTDGLKKSRSDMDMDRNDEVILGEQEMIIMHGEKLTSISALILTELLNIQISVLHTARWS